jgi:predicted nucleotidyltransferase
VFGADRGDGVLQGLHAIGQPGEFLAGDFVGGRIAGVDISAIEPREASLGKAGIARPGGDQPRRDPFGLRAQEGQPVRFWALCRAADYAERDQVFALPQRLGGDRRGIVSSGIAGDQDGDFVPACIGGCHQRLAPCLEDRQNPAMRKDVDHLPLIQQNELERVRQTLMDEFAIAIARATQPWKKNGKIQKIVLFGSYARDDWVDEPENGYQSDYDILVIVSHKDLTDVAEYWYVAEDKIERDAAVGHPANIIVHTLDEVNQGLTRGEYFWVDIARDGIALYELPGVELAPPKPLTAADAYEMADAYLADWMGKVDAALERLPT